MTNEIETVMRRYDGRVPGASLLVIRNDEPVIRRSWGCADIENGVLATSRTNYRLASVSKQFTAAAVLLLAEDGRVSLGDRLREFFPSLAPSLDAVTIHHLLTHASGLIDYEELISPETTMQLCSADVLQLLEAQKTGYFAPGSNYRYSNSGYALLALIVERVSGGTFADFLARRVFGPLGMNHTVAHEEGISTVGNRAFGYTMTNGEWARKDQSLTSAVLGDGGIYSSIDDLAKWDAAWYDGRLLSDESRRVALIGHTATDDPSVSYGFGWRITGETFWHSGETSGFRNVIVRYAARTLTIVLLTNRDDPEPYETALVIAKINLDSAG